MLLALCACTNDYYKTTRCKGPITQKFESKERASPRINIRSHLSCRTGLPEGSIYIHTRTHTSILHFMSVGGIVIQYIG